MSCFFVVDACPLGIVPILVGPLQALLALLPAILVGVASVIATAFKPRTILLFLKLLWHQKFVLVPLVAAVIALWVYGPRVWPQGASGTAALADAGDSPAFRGGMDRRGWVFGAPDPVVDERHWSVTDPHATIYSSPAVVGDYVFFVTAHVTPFNISGTGRIQCLDAHTGQRIWQDQLSDLRATFSTPAIADGYLVIGEGLHFTSDARVICLDSATGRTLWTYRTRSHVESSPVIADGRVYVGAGDDGLYCFALEPDAQGNAQLLWHASGDVYLDCEASPVVYDGKVYMGLGFHGNAVVAFDAVTGEELWKTLTPYPVFGSPVIHDGVLFVGMGNGNFVFSAEQIWQVESQRLRDSGEYSEEEIEAIGLAWQAGGAVWCLNPYTGEVIWTYDTTETVIANVVANEQHVFFGCRDGQVHKVNRGTGAAVHTWHAGAPLLACPALAEEHVYFVSGAGILHGLRQDTLESVFQSVLWETPPRLSDYFLSSPTVAHGRIYVGTPTLGLLAVGRPGEPPLPVWEGRHGGPGVGGIAGRSPVPERMEIAGRYRIPEEEGRVIAAPVVPGSGQVFVLFEQTGEQGESGFELAALTWENMQDEHLSVQWRLPVKGPVVDTLTLVQGKLYGVAERDGTTPLLWAVSVDEGTLLWEQPLLHSVKRVQAVRDMLLLAGEQGVQAFSLDMGVEPAALWQIAGAVAGSGHAVDSRVALTTSDPGLLRLLDLRTGRELWRVALDADPLAGPVVRGRYVYQAVADGVLSLDLLDGQPRWRQAVDDVDGELLVTRDTVLVSRTDGAFTVLDGETGQSLGRTGVAPQWPIVSDDHVYMLGSRGFSRYDVRQPAARPDVWMRWDRRAEGDVLFAPVIREGRLAIATTCGMLLAAEAEGQ